MVKFESPEINVLTMKMKVIIPVGHITRLPAAPTAISRSN